ncbi:MAG: S8 family serine peptidase [Acidobacteriota bacterium]
MKFSPRMSRYVAVCLCLFFSYALLISNIAPFAPQSIHAKVSERKSEGPVKNLLRSNHIDPEKQAKSSNAISFLQGSSQAQTRDGEVLVRFRISASEQDRNLVALTHNVQRKKLRGESGVERLRTQAGQSAESLALALLQQPAVEFAEPNFLIKPDQINSGNATAPNDAQFAEQWALRNTGQNGGQYASDIGASTAWQTTTGLQSTVIAVIDSGIDFEHPDLVNNQWTNPAPSPDGDLHGWDYTTDNAIIKDEQGHGTAIAGIIAAQGNNATGISGVMWRASLMSLRVLDNTGTGDIGDAVEAIDYAVAHGAQVINISWGTHGESLVLKDAIERAMRSGVVVVCSAGNGSQDVDASPYYPASFGLRDLITVAATDNFDRLATWSNWGTTKVTVAAPGIEVLTTKMGGGYWNVTGTSASAPLVTGVVGLITSAHPALNTHKVAKAINDEARKAASLFGKVSSGGVVSASASLGSLRGSSNQRPPTPTPGYGSGGTGPGGTFSTTPPAPTTTNPGANLPNLDPSRTPATEQPRGSQTIQANLMCADCDPQGGGGGGSYYPAGDPNFSSARELPRNETGQSGEDLGSRNFNWSQPLVNLPGRAGMDLNLALTYNSLVWAKDGSNIKYNADFGTPAPGFRLGLPKLQQRFLNSQTNIYAYMMVTPSGGRVEMRQIGSSSIYESQDGTYTKLDVTNPSAPIIYTRDGTKLTFSATTVNNEHRCVEIKDRNGNLISATYDLTTGHLLTITDTLNRVLTFAYNASGNLEAIRQTWGGSTHDWAYFEYGDVYVAPNFSGLNVNGPNNVNVTVLTKVKLLDGTYFTFNYNAAFGQVNRINHYAKDNHLPSYTSYNVDSSAGQTDCPRFTERHDWAENWNNGAEAVTYFAAATDNSWSKVTAPDGVVRKEFYGTTTWQTGLTTTSKVYENAAAESADTAKKWTTISWTQDDTSLLYQKNPRVIETNVYDSDGNRRRITIDYGAYAEWSLPYLVKEYAANGTTELRHSYTDYNLSQAYLDKRIIGLVSAWHISDTAAWKSMVYYAYDGSSLTSRDGTTQHDASFGTGYTARGNLTSVTRYDVEDINNPDKRAVTQLGHDTNGSVISSSDPMGHPNTISYTDSFSDNVNRNTFAYPTTMTDAGGFSSSAKYNYDFGAITRTQDPKGAVQKMDYYPATARLEKITDEDAGADLGYIRYVYQDYGNIATYSKIKTGSEEIYSDTYFDGAGRVRATGGEMPNSVGLHRGQFFLYDIMGRLSFQSNPAEMNGSWAPAGEDAGGWVWTGQTYDWQGRPRVTTNPDSTTRENTYGGCGCAGGEVTMVRDERGRRRKMTMDVLGRLKQVDELNWDQSVYATTSYTYNALDQITSSDQAGQTRSFAYDGHGRLKTRTTPEQGATNYTYFADDTVQAITDARGATTNLLYNSRDLATQISYGVPGGVAATPTVTFTYDAAGNRLTMDDGPGSVSYSYDTMSQLISETQSFDGVTGSFALTYAYNLGGELTSLTGPAQFGSVKVGYDYDKIGRVTGVTGDVYAGGVDYVSNTKYRAFGLKEMGYTNTKTLTLKYDNRMRATEWHVPGVMQWDYSYTNFGENTGRVTYAKNVDDGTLDRSYDYDQVGRLIASHSGREARWHIGTDTWAIDGPYSQLYGHDQFGNRTHREGWGGIYSSGVNDNPTYSSNKQVGLTYDASGNYTAGGTMTYDATGQQIVSGGGVTNAYDGDRLRGKKEESGITTYYLRSSVLGGQVVAEIKDDGSWKRGFVYLGGQMVAVQQNSVTGITAQTTHWVFQDPVTKSQRLTSSAGTVVSTVDLDPFGGETARSASSAFQPHRYTTYERDGNGTDDAMHRRFDATASRFSQPDPYDGSYNAADPQSFNRYAYVNNDPVNFTDPSGLIPNEDCPPGQTPCVIYGGYSPIERELRNWARYAGNRSGIPIGTGGEPRGGRGGPGPTGPATGSPQNPSTLPHELGHSQQQDPIWCQPDVIKAMKTAWSRTGNGTLGTEAGFVLNGTPSNYQIVGTKSANTQGSQKITVTTTGPNRTFAIFHVHPLRGGRNPSTPDNNYLGNAEGDTGIADRLKIDFYVMHRNGLTMYDHKTKQTTPLRENLDWTKPCK